jgi:two-component system, cell cycle response regulator DivK
MANELILIIEDSEPNRRLTRDLLRIHGYRTIEAGTAEDGFDLAACQLPDLVVMDIHLPGISGIDALARLRAASATRAIPVMAFTASVMAQDRSEIMAAGFDAFVSKPIDLDAFVAAAAAAVAQRRAGGTS